MKPPLRRSVVAFFALLLLPAAVSLAAAATADVVLADFEGDSYAPWKTGLTAFGSRPARSAAATGTGAVGHGYATSAADPTKDGALRGFLESPEFTIERGYLNFLIGGGNHAFRAALSLWVDGRIVRTTSGPDSDHLAWATWDLRALRGRRAWLGLYDQCIEDPRGYVMVDQIALSDSPQATPGGDVTAALVQVRRQAVAAIRTNAAIAAADPQRPVYHYAPPAQRMNDPNGPAWANGWHHVFYQHMVFEGAGPAIDVHWGHARSRDLVHWETLPLAIAPAYELGELSCFSGNLAWDKNGDPVQFVTMVPYKRDTLRQVWPARPLDPEWIQWERTPEKPPAGLVPHGAPDRPLKDAFPFSAGARRFLVLTDRNIPLYEATDDRLTRWVYHGVIDAKSAECPNFFEVDGRWIYLSSPNAPVRYVVGDFDPAHGRFTPRTEGRLNHDMGYYATTAYRDAGGRTILHGVSRGQKSSPAWTGVLALPRVLTIGPDDRPRMQPVPELAGLRREPFRVPQPLALKNGGQVVAGLRGDTLEIIARFRAGSAKSFGLRVRRSDDGTRALPIVWREGQIVVAKDTPKFPCAYPLEPAGREIVFRVFLDKGLLDVCVDDGRVFESRVHQAPLADLGVEVFAESGDATLLSLEAWTLAPAQITHQRLLTPE
jgi:beta-fructofuranosidase